MLSPVTYALEHQRTCKREYHVFVLETARASTVKCTFS